jgi:hypothetical protein
MVRCDNCEYDNKETAKFCHSCGIKIEASIPTVEKESTAKILEEERKKAETKLEKKGFFKRKAPTRVGRYQTDTDNFVWKDWFWDNVEFRRQSKLAIVLGILQILGTLVMVLFSNDFTAQIIMLLLGVSVGAVLISLGAREVPNYPSLKYAIENYVDSKIKHS